MIIAETSEKIAFFNLCALRGALRLEAAGMKRRGPSALKQAKDAGFKAKTAKAAYDLVNARIRELNPTVAE